MKIFAWNRITSHPWDHSSRVLGQNENVHYTTSLNQQTLSSLHRGISRRRTFLTLLYCRIALHLPEAKKKRTKRTRDCQEYLHIETNDTCWLVVSYRGVLDTKVSYHLIQSSASLSTTLTFCTVLVMVMIRWRTLREKCYYRKSSIASANHGTSSS